MPAQVSSDQPGAATSAPAARLHWIDWLRVAAIAGVVLYHSLRPFNTDGWHVKNAETSALLNGFTTFFASFGLAVLFLLAGVGVRFALRRRSWQKFLHERTARLLVPFVVGTLLLSPVQGFIEATHTGAYSGSYLDYLGVWPGSLSWAFDRGFSPTVFGIGYHLWFLGFLFAISVVALPLCEWMMGERGGRLIRALARRFSWPGVTLTLVIPIYALMGIGSAMGTEEHDWLEFAWYLGYFLVGFVLVSDDRFMAAVLRDLWPAVGLAVVSTGLIVAGIPAPLDKLGDQEGLTQLAMALLFAAEGWAWTLLVLNLGMRATRLQRPVSEHLGDVVLPVYVIHQPVILAVSFFVVQWPLGILPKWLIVFGIAVPITLVLVELALRTPVVRILLGARIRPAAPVAPVAPAMVAMPPAKVPHARSR
jgi:peptidoglycan/LPS O-acetylase OafA/YrhL